MNFKSLALATVDSDPTKRVLSLWKHFRWLTEDQWFYVTEILFVRNPVLHQLSVYAKTIFMNLTLFTYSQRTYF